MGCHSCVDRGVMPLLLKLVVPRPGWSFGRVEPKCFLTWASDRAVKGVLYAHWDEVVSPEWSKDLTLCSFDPGLPCNHKIIYGVVWAN